MSEIIEFDDKDLQSVLKKLLGVDVLTSSDLEKIGGFLLITSNGDKCEISQNDMYLLLKYIKLIEFSKCNFTNMVFKGNGTNKIRVTECTFSDCTFEDTIILAKADEDFSKYENSKIEVEINNLKELQDICKKDKKNTLYSFRTENDANDSLIIMQTYSWEEIMEENNIFEMIRLIVPSNSSNLDKLLIVGVLLCRNMLYDNRGNPFSEEFNRLSEEEKKTYRTLTTTFKGALLRGISICGEYATCLHWGLDAVGINSREVVSDSHAWNQIELDGNGNWFNFCLTNLKDFFESGKDGGLFSYLFLTSNEKIATLGEMYTPKMKCEKCNSDYELDLSDIMRKIHKINSVFYKEMPLGWKQFNTENASFIRDSLKESISER